jgi:hypothetical protein
MPVHDWTKVEAGTFHDFHNRWITHLAETLNDGLLPPGFYALSEQHGNRLIADILTLDTGERPTPAADGGTARLAVAEPEVGQKFVASPKAYYRLARRTLAIRHVSENRVVALVEVLSPGNKDRQQSVEDVAGKVQSAIRQGIHVLLVDLFPPGRWDPHGIHAVIWQEFDPDREWTVPEKPLSAAAYRAAEIPEAFVVSLRLGEPLPALPLFLDTGHIATPLEETYQATYRRTPEHVRKRIEANG